MFDSTCHWQGINHCLFHVKKYACDFYISVICTQLYKNRLTLVTDTVYCEITRKEGVSSRDRRCSLRNYRWKLSCSELWTDLISLASRANRSVVFVLISRRSSTTVSTCITYCVTRISLFCVYARVQLCCLTSNYEFELHFFYICVQCVKIHTCGEFYCRKGELKFAIAKLQISCSTLKMRFGFPCGQCE